MIKITGGIGSFTVSWDPLNIPDLAGYVVCGVTGSADFTPSGANILNAGPESSFTYYTSVTGPWSVKVAAYDTFSNPKALILSDLNFSTLQTVEVLGLTQEVMDALTGQLTEDQLYSALSSRIDLIDDPTTGLMTLFPRVSMTEGQYTVKLNANGHIAGFGLASTAYNGVPTSEFMILADKFKVVNPNLPNDQKQVFTVGTVNGVSGVVGINGALLIDGSLVVSQNVSVGGSVTIGGATLTFAAPTPSGIGAVATNLSNAPAAILNSNVTATSIGAVKTDLTNAPAGILNSNVTLSSLGYTVPTYDLIGGSKPPVTADNTSTILATTGTLTLNQALTINSLLTVSGSAAGITSGLASYSANGTGFWISKDTSNARMRVGTVTGGVLTSGFIWDGSTFKVKGEILATSGTFSGNITSSATITGGTFQTNSSGERFVLSNSTNTGQFYDSAGVLRLSLGSWSSVNGYSHFFIGADSNSTSMEIHGGAEFYNGLYCMSGGYYDTLVLSTEIASSDLWLSCGTQLVSQVAYPKSGNIKCTKDPTTGDENVWFYGTKGGVTKWWKISMT